MNTLALTANTKPETEQAPEIAWCNIEQTVKLLVLAVTQIEVSIGESDASVKTLADAFEEMANGIQEILLHLGHVSGRVYDGGGDTRSDTGMAELCLQLQGKINTAVMALQFHDRLSQRLTQIHRNLDNLSGLLGNHSETSSKIEWCQMQDELRASYTMVEDRALFDALMKGATVAQAVACYRTAQVMSREAESDLF